jgi:hypothetical protein
MLEISWSSSSRNMPALLSGLRDLRFCLVTVLGQNKIDDAFIAGAHAGLE